MQQLRGEELFKLGAQPARPISRSEKQFFGQTRLLQRGIILAGFIGTNGLRKSARRWRKIRR